MTHDEDAEFKLSSRTDDNRLYVLLTKEHMPLDLRDSVREEVWD